MQNSPAYRSDIGTYNAGDRDDDPDAFPVSRDDSYEEEDLGDEESDDDDEDIAYDQSKRRRIQNCTEDEDDESDTDVSIQLLAEREVSEDEEDIDLLQALEDPQQERQHEREMERREPDGASSTDVEVSSVDNNGAGTNGNVELQATREGTPYQEPIDSDIEVVEQQVVEVPASEFPSEAPTVTPTVHKSVKDYRCPICFDPPDTAVMTPCGHVFCVACLFQMVNSSRTHRRSGHCALCRTEVKLRDIRMVVLRKKRVKKAL